MSATPWKIAAREMLSNAPSTDKMVDRGSNSERACTTCATHSVPARVECACWNGCVAGWTAAHWFARRRPLSLALRRPAWPKLPSNRLSPPATPPQAWRPSRTVLPPPLRTAWCTWCLPEGAVNVQRSSGTDLPLHLFQQCADSSATSRRRG